MMNRKLSVRQIILHYIKLKISDSDLLIRNSEMEKVKDFGFKNFGVFHSVGIYEREWRRIKNSLPIKEIGLSDLKQVEVDSKENVYAMVINRNDIFSG